MSGFQHDIAGGQGDLIIQALQSPNFLSGSTGWQIAKSGSAEFNNLTLRGTFDGTDFVVNSAGAFFYSGTPALGNLIASIASVAGTDAKGNAYGAGIISYDPSGSSYSYYIQLLNNVLTFHYNSVSLFIDPGQIQANEPLVASVSPSLELISPNDNTTTTVGVPVQALVKVQGLSQDGSSTPAIVIEGIDAHNNVVTADLVLKGTIIQADKNGMYFYSGTAGSGNLVMSLVPGTATVTDPFGNSCPPGFTVGQSTATQIQMVSSSGTGKVVFKLNNASYHDGGMQGVLGVNFAELTIQGPNKTTAGHTDFVTEVLSSSDGSTTSAGWALVYVDANSVSNTTAYGDWTGFNIPAGKITAVTPGTGTGPTNAATAETWHTMPAFINSFSHGTPAPSYKLMPDNTVQLAGVVTLPGSGSYNSINFTTLPSGYRPISLKRLPASISAVGTYNGDPHVFIDTSGNMQIVGYPSAQNGQTFWLDGMRFPLDF